MINYESDEVLFLLGNGLSMTIFFQNQQLVNFIQKYHSIDFNYEENKYNDY